MTTTTETRRLIARHFDVCDGMADGTRHCEICDGHIGWGDTFWHGRTVQVADMVCCGADCALEAIGGPEPTVPAPPVPVRELARDAWKRIGGGVPEQAGEQPRWPATEALLEAFAAHRHEPVPAAEMQYVYRHLHFTALDAECSDLFRLAGIPRSAP